MKIVKAMPFLAMGTMALGLVGVTVLAPVANAEEPKPAGAQQTVQVAVGSNLSIKLKKGTETVKGTLDGKESATTEGEVEGNPTKGFTVNLADADNDTNLRLDGGNSGAPIPAEDNINENSQVGWSVVFTKDNNKVRKAMPAKNSSEKLSVVKTDAPSSTATQFNVAYAFKTDNSIPSGTYSDIVEYTVIANQ